jgi:hypothetical protein
MCEFKFPKGTNDVPFQIKCWACFRELRLGVSISDAFHTYQKIDLRFEVFFWTFQFLLFKRKIKNV